METRRPTAQRAKNPPENFKISTTFSIRTYFGFRYSIMSINTSSWRFLISSKAACGFLKRLKPLTPWHGGPPQIKSTSPYKSKEDIQYIRNLKPKNAAIMRYIIRDLLEEAICLTYSLLSQTLSVFPCIYW